MPNSVFSTDFGFRRGSESALNRTAVLDGTFNLAIDTGNLYIDIDGQRISTRDITIKETEAEIRAIADPNPRMYFAKDSFNFLFFDITSLSWKLAGAEYVKNSEKAEKDSNGNIFEEFYETIENSDSKIADVNADIESLRQVVGQISSFEIVVLDDPEDLPLEGTPHTIYFVPQDAGDEDTMYDEYVWLPDEEYYEKIGMTKPDLGDYYKKTEVDDLLSDLETNLEGQIGNVANDLSTLDEDYQTTKGYVSANMQSIEDLATAIEGYNIDSMGRDSDLRDAIRDVKGGNDVDVSTLNLKSLDEKDAAIIGDDSIDLSDINLHTLNEKDASIIGDDTLDLTETNLKSLKDTTDDHETRIAYLEEHGGGGGSTEELQEQIDAIKGDPDLDTSIINLHSLKEAIDLIEGGSESSITELIGRIDSAERDIDTLETDVTGLKEDSADYKAYKTSNDARVTNVQSTLQTNITTVNNDLQDHINSAVATDTDLQEQIDALETSVDNMGRFKCIIVNEVTDLPAIGENGTLYFVPEDASDPDNERYSQYIWVEDEETYHLIGLTTIDLTDYYTKDEVTRMVNSVLSNIGYDQGWVSVNGHGDAVIDFGME